MGILQEYEDNIEKYQLRFQILAIAQMLPRFHYLLQQFCAEIKGCDLFYKTIAPAFPRFIASEADL